MTSDNFDIQSLIGIGDNVVDNYLDMKVFYPGGNALNVAVLANRYGLKNCGYMGIIGNDIEGGHIKSSLLQEGVDISRLRIAMGESGKAYVRLDEHGDRVFDQSNKGGIQSELKINFHEKDFAYLKKFSLVHTSAYSHLDNELAELSRHALISYDFSTSKDTDRLNRICPFITFGFFSCSDMSHQQAVRFAESIQKRGVPHTLVTLGDKGAIYLGNDGFHVQKIDRIVPVDTLGAGDSYIAGFLTSKILGASISEGMRFGAEMAVKTCLHYGAFGYSHDII